MINGLTKILLYTCTIGEEKVKAKTKLIRGFGGW